MSRELRIAGGSEAIQNKDTGSYFVEAQYIEFDGVKVSDLQSLFCDSPSSDHHCESVSFNNHLRYSSFIQMLSSVLC